MWIYQYRWLIYWDYHYQLGNYPSTMIKLNQTWSYRALWKWNYKPNRTMLIGNCTTDRQTNCVQAHSPKTLLGKTFHQLLIVEQPFTNWNSGFFQHSPSSGTYVCSFQIQKNFDFLPSFHKVDRQKSPPKPIMVVEDRLQNDENFQWRNRSLLLPQSHLMTTETREGSAPTYAHLSGQMHRVSMKTGISFHE